MVPGDDDFQIVQSRPITTLFPIPKADDQREPCLRLRRASANDDRPHEAARALGMAADDATAHGRSRRKVVRRCHPDIGVAGGSRYRVIETLGKSDPLIQDALQTVVARGDFVRARPDEGPGWAPPGGGAAPSKRIRPSPLS